ncbi:MAG: ABC transporter ATP-binding protein [Pseudomonadota bacterium]
MLDVHGLCAHYGQAQILNDVSLSVADGEVVALLGRNGAGKSTTMKAIMGLLRRIEGRITYNGQTISGQDSYRICRTGIGYVPEDRRIFKELTVEENLEVGRRAVRKGVPEWTPENLFDLFPNLRERKHNPGKHLSGGEQQMLTIARTLMGNPSLVMLDEPSEGIAPVIVEQMADVILKLKRQGLSVLISEQNLHFARIVADRALIIESGQMRYEGTFQELADKPEISQRYLAV